MSSRHENFKLVATCGDTTFRVSHLLVSYYHVSTHNPLHSSSTLVSSHPPAAPILAACVSLIEWTLNPSLRKRTRRTDYDQGRILPILRLELRCPTRPHGSSWTFTGSKQHFGLHNPAGFKPKQLQQGKTASTCMKPDGWSYIEFNFSLHMSNWLILSSRLARAGQPRVCVARAPGALGMTHMLSIQDAFASSHLSVVTLGHPRS
ncbi:hypothetical protein P692DRAFT_20950341 [Suillus brevipes Sb2]|nr:hypothetical protein P692DRAFT_20950341 [Suillus brevipes Sb2]